MTEEDRGPDDLPQATAVPPKRARISVVWVIPVLAAVVALGIGLQRLLSEGPTITITFKAAAGIEAGKTFVKYKDVNIGQVTAVRLSPDYTKVEVTAQIAKSAEGLIVEDAKFWVVEPRITLSGVSGLGTLLSGNYIGFEAGKSATKQRQFVGLDVAPIITGGQPGRQFTLKADTLGSLGIGAPVYYRQLQAGQVIAYDLAPDGMGVNLTIFVNAPYDKYVTKSTRFWNASGVDVSVGAGGVDVRLQSLVALIAGGVAFDTPAFAALASAEPAPAKAVFALFKDQTTALKQPDPVARRFVLYFPGALLGLSVGAPVTMLGLPGGEVTAVGLDIDPRTQTLRGRVEIVAYPERLVAELHAAQAAAGEDLVRNTAARHAFFERMVEQRGMRAQLRSGSLLTGQLYVAFDFFPDAPKATIDWRQDPTELPTVPSTMTDIETKVTSLVAKLERLPYEAIGADVTKALMTLNQTLGETSTAIKRIDSDVTPELKGALVDLRRAIATIDEVLKPGVTGTLTQVNTVLEELRAPLASADQALKHADASLLSQQAPVQDDLRDTLQELARAARSLRVLADYLEQHPESLLRGKTEEKP